MVNMEETLETNGDLTTPLQVISAKKVVYYQNAITQSSQVVYEYPFPIIRLGDLYLMYAESLNEANRR